MEWILLVSSVTNAMRGKSVLERNGYNAHVQRAVERDGSNGCGYSILTNGDGAKAEQLLLNAGIRRQGAPRGRDTMIYLDNAATTWPKPLCVRETVRQCMELYGANPGRGGHAMGMAASREVYRCRETAAAFFHLDNPGHVVFTMNCTMSLNIVIKGLLRYGGHVVVSSLEHNAVLRPLNALSASGRVYSVATVVPGDPEETVRNFHRCITPRTKAILCTHASNVFGFRLPIREIGELAHRMGLLFVVDAAQSAASCPSTWKPITSIICVCRGTRGCTARWGPGCCSALRIHRCPPLWRAARAASPFFSNNLTNCPTDSKAVP